MTGHKDKLHRGILGNENLHIVEIALGIVSVDATPRPHYDIDMAVCRVVEKSASCSYPRRYAIFVDRVVRAQIIVSLHNAIIIKIKRA